MEIGILEWLTNAIPNIGLMGIILWVMVTAFIKDKDKSLTLASDNHKEAMKDLRTDKENLMQLFLRQDEVMTRLENVLCQQKDMLEKQNRMLEKTDANMILFQKSLDKISETQISHAVKLEKIEQEIKNTKKANH